jgi:hypothetical protein
MKNTDILRSEFRDPDDEPLSITSNEVSKIGSSFKKMNSLDEFKEK